MLYPGTSCPASAQWRKKTSHSCFSFSKPLAPPSPILTLSCQLCFLFHWENTCSHMTTSTVTLSHSFLRSVPYGLHSLTVDGLSAHRKGQVCYYTSFLLTYSGHWPRNSVLSHLHHQLFLLCCILNSHHSGFCPEQSTYALMKVSSDLCVITSRYLFSVLILLDPSLASNSLSLWLLKNYSPLVFPSALLTDPFQFFTFSFLAPWPVNIGQHFQLAQLELEFFRAQSVDFYNPILDDLI